MKKLRTLFTLVMLAIITTTMYANNWQWDADRSKWVKDITPTVLQFSEYQTAEMQALIYPVPGGANPNPAITRTSGEDLTNGYIAVSGGQITANDATSPAVVRQAFCITTDSATLGAGLLRAAQSTANVEDGFKAGKFLGFFNLNFYIPTAYSYTGYTVAYKGSVYTSAGFSQSLLVYTEAGSQLGTTQSYAGGGWNDYSFEQTDALPFRFKISLPNTAGLVAYLNTPVMEMISATEPVVRTIDVIKTGNGTVTMAYETVRDQDVQIITLTPDTGEEIIDLMYNSEAVTLTDNGDGSYSFTTPLLTEDATLDVSFSEGVFTGIDTTESRLLVYTTANGEIMVTSSSLTSADQIRIYSVTGQQLMAVPAAGKTTSIQLQPGVFIVEVQGESRKVML